MLYVKEMFLDQMDLYDSTGRSAYIEACKHFGVIPITSFLNNMTEREMNLQFYGIGSKGAKAMAAALLVTLFLKPVQYYLNNFLKWEKLTGNFFKIKFVQSNTVILYLNLKENDIGAEGSKFISAMLKENCFIVNVVSK